MFTIGEYVRINAKATRSSLYDEDVGKYARIVEMGFNGTSYYIDVFNSYYPEYGNGWYVEPDEIDKLSEEEQMIARLSS